VTAVLTALAVDTPQPVQAVEPRIPRPLSDLITELLAKRPEQRPPSAQAVLERLQQIERAHGGSTSQLAVAGGHARARLAGLSRWQMLLALVALSGLGVALIIVGVIHGLSRPGERAAASLQASKPAVVPEAQRIYINKWKPIDLRNWPLPPTPKGDIMHNVYEVITIDGKESPHGIGMHPSFEGPAYVSYALDKQYDTFQGEVSLTDSVDEADSPMLFSIRGDGQLLWKSKGVQVRKDTQPFKVSVKGVDVLKLEVDAQKKARGCHGVWVEPFLTK
jgi:hypothetical protein